ncbi:HEPN/Toprim-associated domain-containing protein [Idiomarina ramblicola]|uniref:Uncharacterized protein n=1 Tax=Idiomarina ramblicola TaxID=263724 RepID=A0A432YYC7_9GAMM|nr:HEPN/Toprim-associated domain-containing protein [Idiomarina ramblicola]RUO68343.1 hypothetical protein CWI78_08985 [Idiomarina ramblicola]
MSTWAGVDLGEYSIEEWQNTYHKWLFNDTDRVRETPEDSFIGYRIDTATLRRRLELQGVNRLAVETEMDEVKLLWIKEMKELLSDTDFREHHDNYLCYIDGLLNCSIDSWLKLIPVARAISISEHKSTQNKSHETENLTAAEQNLLKFMCSNYDEYPNYSAGAYHFPCKSSFSYAWAILHVVESDVVCELDISGLIDSGWVEDFDDLAEYQAGQTKFYERAKVEINEITQLSRLDEANRVLQRISYSGLVTILEAYLSDIVKRQVLNKESIKRRFVEKFDPFAKSQKKLEITEIYFRMEQLDQLIIDCIDNLSFHSVKTIKDFFSSVLLISIPHELSDSLAKAIITRHDIVHRAGRTKDGDSNEVSQSDVQALSQLLMKVMACIDSQIVDGLLGD